MARQEKEPTLPGGCRPPARTVRQMNDRQFMGKGIALQFKKAYPENFDAYRNACAAGEVQPGRMFIFEPAGAKKYAGQRSWLFWPNRRPRMIGWSASTVLSQD